MKWNFPFVPGFVPGPTELVFPGNQKVTEVTMGHWRHCGFIPSLSKILPHEEAHHTGASEERLVELLSIKVRTRWGDHKHLEARNNSVRRRDWCHLGAEEARGISSSQNLKTKGRDRETHVEKAVGKSLAYSGRMWPVQSELIIELDTWVQRTGNLLTQVRFLEK